MTDELFRCISDAQAQSKNDKNLFAVRTPQTAIVLHLCSKFNPIKVPADAIVAVNSPPIATAHHQIGYAAVGGEKDLGTDHLITLCVTDIHCKPPWIHKVCKQSPRAIPTVLAIPWPKSSYFPFLINQLSKQVLGRSFHPVPQHLSSIQKPWQVETQLAPPYSQTIVLA